jgi:DNA-binding Lrp family transcriptional regulator
MTPSATELELIDRWQRGFPLEPRPFATVGRSVGLDESAAIAKFERLIKTGVLTRIGAVVRPHSVGASTLVAMRAPPSRLEAVAAIVNAEPLVNHNYAREHPFNLWFVVTGPDRSAVRQTIERVKQAADLPVIDLRRIVAATQAGLPLVAQPYRVVAKMVGTTEAEVIARLERMLANGAIRRIGAVPNHYALGFSANGMSVWDVADEKIVEVGAMVGALDFVTHCYQRPRHLPLWPYNLFAMAHGRTRAEVEDKVGRIAALIGDAARAHEVLYSTRILKKTGLRIAA